MLKMYISSIQSVDAIKRRLKNIGRDESGATMLEYTLLAGLISIAGVASILLIAPQISGIWTKVSTHMTAANAAAQ